jgi:hypothetical protein
MQGFDYPTAPQIRRHGPAGYKHYEKYREWLRDEFLFRCVYCLQREQWYDRAATFNIDHFIPVAIDPAGKLEYVNLVYACAPCNIAKRAILGVPDPCNVAFGDCVQVQQNGEVAALNNLGRILIEKLRLNSAKNVNQRFRWMRILEAVRLQDQQLYDELMAFPDDLPDLRAVSVPENVLPDGVHSCWYALRENGTLPTGY